MGKPVSVGQCDFRNLKLKAMKIPENAIIFTSYSLHYVSNFTTIFVKILLELKPKIVVHFEPCYEHYTNNSLHEMMCKRYIELNDYTRNLVSVFKEEHSRKSINVRMQKNVMGANPFLPLSVIEWTPIKQ